MMKKLFLCGFLFLALPCLASAQTGFGWSVGLFRTPDTDVNGLHFQGHGRSWGGYIAYGQGQVTGRAPRGDRCREINCDRGVVQSDINAPIREHTERTYLALGPLYAVPFGEHSAFYVHAGYVRLEDNYLRYQEATSSQLYIVHRETTLNDQDGFEAGLSVLLRGLFIGSSYASNNDEWRITLGGGWR